MVSKGKLMQLVSYISCNISLGGGNSNIFGIFTPNPWGFMIQFDQHICFNWVLKSPRLHPSYRDSLHRFLPWEAASHLSLAPSFKPHLWFGYGASQTLWTKIHSVVFAFCDFTKFQRNPCIWYIYIWYIYLPNYIYHEKIKHVMYPDDQFCGIFTYIWA